MSVVRRPTSLRDGTPRSAEPAARHEDGRHEWSRPARVRLLGAVRRRFDEIRIYASRQIRYVSNTERVGRRIESDPGTPRSGPAGYWDRLVGPTATAAEQTLTVAFATLAAAIVWGHAVATDLGWSWLQLAVVTVFVFDVAGGITANATASGRRWWHRPELSDRDHFLFVAAHLHPFVLAALFAGVTWIGAAIIYGYLLLATVIVLRVDPSIRRASALALFGLWLLAASYVSITPVGLEWFVPLLYLKLLVSHLLGAD